MSNPFKILPTSDPVQALDFYRDQRLYYFAEKHRLKSWQNRQGLTFNQNKRLKTDLERLERMMDFAIQYRQQWNNLQSGKE